MPYPPKVRIGSHIGTIPVADIFHGGYVDYNDAATSVTPISLAADTWTKLTNDELGPFTNKVKLPDGVTSIWNSANNQFDWSQLKLGDMVDIRIDIDVTTSSNNQTVDVALFLGVGAGEYPIDFIRSTYKTTGSKNINIYNGIYKGDSNTLDNPAELRIHSDSTADVVVVGWYCKIIRRG